MAKYGIHIMESLPGVFGKQGKMTFIPGEQGTKVKFSVEQSTKAILGNMEHKKQFSILKERGNKLIYFRATMKWFSP